MVTFAQAVAPADDYLSPELRARVERLKPEAPQLTVDPATVKERMDTLWEWSSAFAIHRGIPLPKDFSYLFAPANRVLLGSTERLTPNLAAMLVDELGNMPPRNIADFVARYTREFQLKEEHPNALGTVALSDSGPFVVGDTVTLTQTWTVGDVPMVEGGGVMIANRRGGPVQAENPRKANFVSLSCSKPGVRFEKAEPWENWRTFLTRAVVCYRLATGSLTAGDTVVITYRDMSVGRASVDALNLPFYADLEASGHILTPSLPTYGVIGAPETSYVNAVAPSIVTPGETFELAVRSEDLYKNPVSGRTPSYQVTLAGEAVATLPPSNEPVTVVRDLRLPEAGVYRFEVQSADGSLHGRSNPVWVQIGPAHRIYWGDTHTHTGYADGMGTPDSLYRYARDFARLDFFTHSEHDIWTDEYEWLQMQSKATEYTAPGDFTPILGYEWTAQLSNGGHNNVYFRTAERRRPVTNRDVVGKHQLYLKLREVHDPRDVVIIPHAHAPGDWRLNDPVMERVVEMQSGHGTFEWYGNRFLEQGWKVGFIGSSDNHATHGGYSPGTNRQLGGLAAVLAPENTSEAVFDALRARACYATTGERIILDVTLDGERMGRTVPEEAERRVRCRVMGTEPIEAADLIKNGEVLYTKRYLDDRIEPRMRVKVAYESPRGAVTGPYGRSGRRHRPWETTIEVKNARLVGVAKPWYFNPTSFLVERDEENPNRLSFKVHTSGRGQALFLELDGAGPATEIVVHTEREKKDFVFRLDELTAGPKEYGIPVAEYTDTVAAQLVPDDGALDQEFVFTDTGELKPGDYYYVRVRQVDGSMAWSSPFWTGAD
jgi:hypothetical protein